MGKLTPVIPTDLKFYITAPHECSYLDGRVAVTLFADPERSLDPLTFASLSEMGFRRSGCLVYTPRCPECSACIPTRVVVDRFKPDRSQRRNLKANSDLEVRVIDGAFTEQHIELYRHYIRARHPGDSMDVESRAEVERFFLCNWSNSFFLEFLLEGKPIALTVVDELRDGLSAVYTFYEPGVSKRGPGVFAVLSLVKEARRRGLPYVYLGYLIHESPKMAYKSRYQPLEEYFEGGWRPSHDSNAFLHISHNDDP